MTFLQRWFRRRGRGAANIADTTRTVAIIGEALMLRLIEDNADDPEKVAKLKKTLDEIRTYRD